MTKIMTKKQKRFALLLACKDSEYVKSKYGGYFDVFLKALRDDDGDSWDLFRVVEGDFPSLEEIGKYDGFVISGSPYDAYSNDLWILALCFLLQTLDAMRKKVLGICFGHQVLSRALGGRVGKARGGWDLGLRKVVLRDDLPRPMFFDRLEEIPRSVSIIECHQDEVWEVPVGAEVIAFSEKTGVEMFHIGEHILGIQGHPEYTKDILCNLVDRLVANQSITTCSGDAAKVSLAEVEPDKKFWEELCKSFLKGE